jgi:glycosyltransferase involved in cell wall biosynthesis
MILKTLKKAGYICFYSVSAFFLFFYDLFTTVHLAGRKPTPYRNEKSINLVIPYEPGEKSGASNGIKSLIDDLGNTFNLEIVPIYEINPRENKYLLWLSEALTSALPMPKHCRPFLMSPQSVLGRIKDENPVFIEFVSGSLSLVFGKRPENMIILRDHENLCRRLMMEYRKSKGMESLLTAAQFLICYLLLYNIYLKLDKIVTLTEQDSEAIIRYFPFFKNKVVHISRSFNIPVEVDGPSVAAGRKELMFVANFYHKPNTDGLLWFLREVAPYLEPGFTLHLIGLAEPLERIELDSPYIKVIKHGFVDDLDSRFHHVGIAIAPAISGSGVRTKSLFLASLKKAIVTTELGNECINFIHGQEAIICNDGKETAMAINRLINRPDEIVLLGNGAFKKVKRNFDSGAVLLKYKSYVFS